jgi:superfamily II DNA or RNA helicase
MIKLRPYQQDLYDKTHVRMFDDGVKKLCVVLPTGGGKSVLIAKLAQTLPGRTLILTHRIEILQQNSEWLKNASLLTAKENTLKYNADVVIAMVQTAFARIKKYGTEYLGEFDNIILDEVQILIFQKVFEKYDYKRLIGFTGTPVLNKTITTTIDEVEFVEPFTLSEIFDDLVQGTDTQDLIDLGYLVQDYNIVLELPDFDKLKESASSPDGYTANSLNSVYGNSASLNILREAYQGYCLGKKTLIFNASTKINKKVYDYFLQLGLNVKLFDTVNETSINPKTDKPYTRKEIIEWFRSERDAVLINTNVFTTGFDVGDVECVMVNRATKSLALWIQMVGRGSRTTDVIYKDKFTVVDLGQNIHQHGIWSMRRNWDKYFHPHGRKRKNKADMLDTWECKNCGSYNLTGEIKCTFCGEEKNAVITVGKQKKLKNGTLEEVGKMPLPKANSIISYCKKIDEGSNFAFLLLEKKIVDLFIYYNVSADFYQNNRKKFDLRVMEIYRPVYFGIIRSDLPGARKRLTTQLNRVLTKINKIYEL